MSIHPHGPGREASGRFTNGGENRFRRLWRFATKPDGELCILSILTVKRKSGPNGKLWELRWFPDTLREVPLLKPERVAKLPNHRRWDWCRVEGACTADYEVARHGFYLDQGLCHSCRVELLGPAREQELEGVRDPRSRGKRGAEWLDTIERVSKGAYTKH